MKKLFITILLAAFLFSSAGILIGFGGFGSFAAKAEGEVNPFEGYIPVNTFLDLARIGRHPEYPNNSNYVLTADIELPYPGRTRPEGEEFVELVDYIQDYFLLGGSDGSRRWRGWSGVEFEGIFDGNGFTISGLAGDRRSGQLGEYDPCGPSGYGGLFKVVYNSVRNLRIIAGATTGDFKDFLGGDWTGVVTGWLCGTVENCHVEGADGSNFGGATGSGGIAGYLQGGTVLNCTVKNLTVASEYCVGGLVGYMSGGKILNSGAECTYTSGGEIGGIVSMIESDEGMLVENCYAGGIVACAKPSGGIVAIYKGASNVIRNCVSYLKPESSSAAKSDGVARWHVAGNIIDCYSSTEDGGATARGNTISKEVMQSEFFVNNVLNYDESVFLFRDGQYPAINPNPAPLAKIRINASGIVESVNGLAFFLNRETKLTAGEYFIKVKYAGETCGYTVNIDKNTAYVNDSINLYFLTFYTGLNEKIETVLVEEGYNPQERPSPEPGLLIDGWFTDKTNGELLTAVTSDCMVWAQYRITELGGSCPADTLITLSAITLIDGTEGSFEPIAKTAAMGLYSFSALKLGVYRLTFEKDGYCTTFKDIDITAGQTDAGSIMLESLKVAGQTVDYCKVTLLDGMNNFVAALSTGYEGSFSFGSIKNGEYVIKFEKSSFRTRTIEITVKGKSIWLNSEVEEGQIMLSQTVLSGTSKSGSTVSLMLNDVLLGSVLVEESGKYVFTGIANAAYTLMATLEKYVTQTANIIVSGGADVEYNFTLDEEIAISGRTTAKSTVELWLNGNLIKSINAGAYGEYSFSNLTAGEYTLVFKRERYVTEQYDVNINGQSVADGLYLLQRSESDVPKIAGYIIEGVIVLAIVAGIYIMLSSRSRKRRNKNI